MLVWRKLASAAWEDAWVERLAFLGPQRLAITSLPNARTVRIEAYAVTEKEGRDLRQRFGGQLRESKDSAAYIARPRAPIRIRRRLVLVASEAERAAAEKTAPPERVLLIPAAMAFGTGEHATTAQCLRFLCDAAAELKGVPWEMLDLGTGSGILAIAARRLGARRADAFDFDPHAVRVARENARLNGATRLHVRKCDVTRWEPERTWDVVTANLYSEVLIGAANVIARCVAPGGRLLISGLLRTQEADCARAFRKQRLRLIESARRGKWVTLSWRAPLQGESGCQKSFPLRVSS